GHRTPGKCLCHRPDAQGFSTWATPLDGEVGKYGKAPAFRRGCAHHSCRISVLSGGSPPGEGKSPAGGRYWQSRTGRPFFSAQRSTWLRHSSRATLARLLLHTSVPPSAVTRSAGLSRLWSSRRRSTVPKGLLAQAGGARNTRSNWRASRCG